MDDAEAIDLLNQGDRRGPEALLERYQMSVYNLSLRMLGDTADAEDATQEVFLKAFQRLHQYRAAEPFGAWLHGIARHQAIDMIRRRRMIPVAAADPIASVDVESAAIASLDRAQVQSALRQLGGRDRALLVLRYWEDQPVATIAQALHLTEGATKVALLRARRALKDLLKAQEVSSHAL
ncbi:MAG TPA: sigma-70 family RNA polymerase sigma factor [Candidatus Limnocylindrales bacterium]|nr:sigma-70 family RNA polymerase sigma factor [Candidatus Limnocylindrales bacterium]